MVHGIFISEPCNGLYYIAERATRGLKGAQKFHWSSMPVNPIAADRRINPAALPYRIRRQAYRWLALGICAALLIATPASAGDYILYECKPTKVLLSIPAEGEIGFQEYTFDRSGALKGGKELPSNLFRIKDGGRRLYYRGKLCIELGE
jgi:hypothetical protein